MAEKRSVKVMINGKITTLEGYESEEYLQRVANYINTKISEMEQFNHYRRMSQESRSYMLAINIADDYFKAKLQADFLEQDIENKDKDAYNVKQDLIAAQMEIERLKKEAEKNKNDSRKRY